MMLEGHGTLGIHASRDAIKPECMAGSAANARAQCVVVVAAQGRDASRVTKRAPEEE